MRSGQPSESMGLLRAQPELLDRFRAGERSALAEVYREYLPRLQRLVRRGFIAGDRGLRVPGPTSPDDLADVLQEVFARAFRRQARMAYDGKREYWAYLATIARNEIVSRHRRAVRELLDAEPPRFADHDPIEVPKDASPWNDPQSLAIVQGYVAKLEEPMRAVHMARYVDALSQRDAAAKLGISRPKVRKVEGKLRLGLLILLQQAGVQVSRHSKKRDDQHRNRNSRRQATSTATG
jgi:RNA polymerase sigma-70 factor (ECF subfamily)